MCGIVAVVRKRRQADSIGLYEATDTTAKVADATKSTDSVAV